MSRLPSRRVDLLDVALVCFETLDRRRALLLELIDILHDIH
jgi:hypothetical protein